MKGNIFLFAWMMSILASCSSTHFSLAPASKDGTANWGMKDREVVDTSTRVEVGSRVLSADQSAQFMLRFVNKSSRPVTIDPVKIYSIQTNENDATMTVRANSTPPFRNASQQENLETGVAVGVIAIAILAAVVIASNDKDTKSNTNNRSHHTKRKDNYNRNRCTSRHYRYDTDCTCEQKKETTPVPDQTSIVTDPYWKPLRQQILEPGGKTEGMIRIDFIPDLKSLQLVIPGLDSSAVKFNYSAGSF